MLPRRYHSDDIYSVRPFIGQIPPVELPKLAATGGLSHVAYGLWRFDDQLRTGRDQFMEAAPRVGADAYLTHDAVLAFHELAQVNPRRIRIGTPHRPRTRAPDFIEVIRQQIDLPTSPSTNTCWSAQRSTVTLRNVAGMMVRSGETLVFWAVNRSSSSALRSVALPLDSAAAKAFIVGP